MINNVPSMSFVSRDHELLKSEVFVSPGNSTELHFYLYENKSDAIQALENGEINILADRLNPDDVQDPAPPNVYYWASPDRILYYIGFNFNRKPLDDVVVRKALTNAIDTGTLIDNIYNGYGDGMTYVLPNYFGDWINMSAEIPQYSVYEARNGLDAAGYTDTNSDGWREYTDDGIQGNGTNIVLELLAPNNDWDPYRAAMADEIANQAFYAGLKINVVHVDINTMVNNVFVNNDFDLYLLGWYIGFTPELIFQIFKSGRFENVMHYSNPDFDALADQFYTTLDLATQINIVQDAQSILANDLPYIWLFTKLSVTAYRTDQVREILPLCGGLGNWWTTYLTNTSDGILKIGVTIDAPLNNPYFGENIQSALVNRASMENIVQIHPDTFARGGEIKVIPWLLSDYSFSLLDTDGDLVVDSQEFELTVRENVTWQDGTPFTAQDINFTIYYVNNLSTYSVQGPFFETVDLINNPPEILNNGMTIRFVTNKIYPLAESTVLNIPILPKHVFETISQTEFDSYTIDTHPELALGTGPWKLDSIIEPTHWKYVRYTNYWNGPLEENTTSGTPSNDTGEGTNETEQPAINIPGFTMETMMLSTALMTLLVTRHSRNIKKKHQEMQSDDKTT